jgi:diguanylate cyclase (GGDEF)-like protein
MTDYNFYYEADFIHNPLKKPVWTGAYLDPAGMGWMMSCIVPIYNGTFLEGVTGLDITIEKLVQHVLTMNLPNQANAFIVDHKGMILAMDETTENLFQLSELKKHKYKTTIKKTIVKPEEFNLFNHSDKNIRDSFSKIFELNMDMDTALIQNKNYLINHKLIPETGWHLFVLSDLETLAAPITELRELSTQAGTVAVFIMIFFYIALFFYFMRRSQKFASKICTPIEALSENTKYVGTEFFSYEYEETDIEEIEQLNKNFDEMTTKLERRTKELIRTEVEKLEKEQEAEKFLLMSITDPLTKLNNRLKIDEILDYEISQSKRYSSTLSVLICDLDHFKRVNDNYGHQTGDKVLISFADILRKNIRVTDTAARWGGEEFIIVFTNTNAQDAAEIAEKLRKVIEEYNFPIEGPLTASFGVTQFNNNENKENFIKRADEALYAAKAASRNTVIVK